MVFFRNIFNLYLVNFLYLDFYTKYWGFDMEKIKCVIVGFCVFWMLCTGSILGGSIVEQDRAIVEPSFAWVNISKTLVISQQ